MYLHVSYVPSSRHVAHISGYLGYLPICVSVRPSVWALPYNASLPTYPIAYSVQRTAYTYIGMRYLGGMYTFPASPLIVSLVRPFHPVQSHLTHPSLPSPLLSSSPSSSSFYSSTPSPTRRPEGFSRRGSCPVMREDKVRYLGTIRGLGWCWCWRRGHWRGVRWKEV